MPAFWRLNFLNGDFTLVEPPSLLQCDRVRAYHLELHKALEGLNVWGPETDTNLYSEFKLYYSKVANIMRLSFDCNTLDPVSRHTFFVCTAPIEHPETKVLIPGLSGLEQIMGYSYGVRSDSNSAQRTTGEPSLDILTSVLLIFKKQGLAIADQLSREDLAKMAVLANELQKPGDEKDNDQENEKRVLEKPIPLEADDNLILQNRKAILEKLHAIGIHPPLDF